MRHFNLVLAAAATLALTIAAASSPAPAIAPIPAPNYVPAPTAQDGRRGFDFEFGTWRTHYRLLKDRLAGSHVWYDCYGTSVIRPFWNGSGNLEDGDLRCPARYISGLTLRLYNPQTHQWTLWWGTRQLAVAPPPQVGHFDSHGVGRFYAHDVWHGTPIICRFQWTLVHGNPHFEQAFSTDGGSTWETNWTTDYVRVPSTSRGVWNAVDRSNDGYHGFDALFGRRVIHESAGCSDIVNTRPFWGGSANLEERDRRCGSRDERTLTMRLYRSATDEWLIYRGTQAHGLTQGLPAVVTAARASSYSS